MKIRNTLVCLIAVFSSVNVAKADESQLPPAYRLQPMEIKEVVPYASELYSDFLVPEAALPNGPEIQAIDWNAMVLIGEKVIEIVKQGKPVVNVKRDAVSVIPAGTRSWSELSGWKAPVTKVYSATVKNYLGVKVIDLRLKVSTMWGGNVKGKGQYLANAIVVPTSIYVLWGFSCDVWSENRDPVNSGSHSNPVAGLGFDIRFRYGNSLNEKIGAQDYFLKGDGTIQETH